ncbi:MAG: signal peptidase I [Patescibacteria group bacterium]|nr:signal peptidase I [Patescibacteria group bacterium]
MKLITKAIYLFLFAFLIFMSATVILSTFSKFKLLVVQSGSMEPSIKRLSVVFIKPVVSYKKGDVVTFRDPNNPKITITHRVVNIQEKAGKPVYTIKGDANNAPDSQTIPPELIIGKVFITIPYLGYPITLAKTIPGFIILIILPALFIVGNEINTIRKEIKKSLSQSQKYLSSTFLILVTIFGIVSLGLPNTNSYLSDREISASNTLTAKIWPTIDMKIIDENKEIMFVVSNISLFKKITYELTYDSDSGAQGVVGTVALTGSEFTRTITLGTCTTGGTCTIHTGVTNIKLHVSLEDNDGNLTSLDKSL